MRLIFGILVISAVFLVLGYAEYSGSIRDDSALTIPSPRQQALLCWHEFQSGRRPTTADCPEL